MQPPGSPLSRGRGPFVAGALAAAAALAVAGRLLLPGEAPAPQAPVWQVPVPESPALATTPPAKEHRLFRSATNPDMSYRDLLTYLNVVGERPQNRSVAAELRRRFQSDPSLRETLERFQAPERADEPGGAKAFIEELRVKPAFQELGRRIVGMPGGTAAVEEIAQDPNLRSFAAELRASATESAPAAQRAGTEKAAGRQALAIPAVGPVSRYSPVASASGIPDYGGAGVPAGAGAPAYGTGASRSATLSGGGTAAGREAEGGSRGGGGAAASGRAHDVGKLAKLEEADGELARTFGDLYPWLVPLGSERLDKIEAATPDYGLWGACFSQDYFPDCKAACESDPKGRCVAMDAWKACLDWKAHAECLVECAARSSYCTAPGATPTPSPGATQLYNFVAGDKATCERSMVSRGLTGACTLGGGCGVSCGRPGPSCPSANPSLWGACMDGPALTQPTPSPTPTPGRTQLYNFVAGDAATCNASIERRNLTGSCRIGGGCGMMCGMPGANCTSANPTLWGACILGPAPAP
ncbi:MAG: hypothetical protein HY553_14495 [Elusimicrobia bacterium]|nr:hypothetical protein [Elusimicrobiota bacterium]